MLDFLKVIDNTDYYHNENVWLHSKYRDTYKELISNKDKWYVKLCDNTKIIHLIDFYNTTDELTKKSAYFFTADHYFSHSEFIQLQETTNHLYALAKAILLTPSMRNLIDQQNDQEEINKVAEKIIDSTLFLSLRDRHNAEFVKRELEINKGFFDTVLEYPLDPQQRESIVELEDNCLVISSAGSGKTSTSIAKVKYLIEKRHIPKEDILVLSYNRKTAAQLRERLGIPGLTCETFHKFAETIIAKNTGEWPDICDAKLLTQCFYALCQKSSDYKKDLTEYFSKIASLTKYDHDYDDGKQRNDDRARYGILAPYGDMNGNAVFTKSEEEKKICTWLTEHGIHFLYEMPYPKNTANEQHRRYKPDFTLFFNLNGQQYYIFLEHFGIDKNGNVPKWFGDGTKESYRKENKKYNDGIIWKRQLHQQENTILIETRSAMFHDGTIWRNLESQLRSVGVPIIELTEEEKYSLLFQRNTNLEDNVMNLFSSFINLMKSNGKSFDSIMRAIENSNNDPAFNERCNFLMFKVIKPLYEEYESTLKNNGQMDFTDAILRATELCNSRQWSHSYSHILVDEFQDISVDRFNFLKSLRTETPMTKMYCVGDDWQSIYRFAGSDLNLFTNYEKYFGFAERCKIETTYRFGNPLAAKSSKFILANPSQVFKEIKPYSSNVFTELTFISFSRIGRDDYLSKISETLNAIPSNESVLLLGRYNNEVNVFPRNCIERLSATSKKVKVTYHGRTIEFMSVHAAKGLEADNVILLNCSQDGGGFPSRISDDPILGYVLSQIDTYDYSEERRLFYVAITRAKKHTYVMYREDMPSIFVKEILEQDNDLSKLRLCPQCKRGSLKIVKEGTTTKGDRYRCLSCNNSIARCLYFTTEFINDYNEDGNQRTGQADSMMEHKSSISTDTDSTQLVNDVPF